MEEKERGIKFEEFRRILLQYKRFIILSTLIRNFIIEKFNIKKLKSSVQGYHASFQPSFSQSSNIFIIDLLQKNVYFFYDICGWEK